MHFCHNYIYIAHFLVFGWDPILSIFREAQVYPSFMAGFVGVFGLLVFGTCLLFAPMRWFLRRFVLPSPGEGPTEEAMDKGFLKVCCIGDDEQ